MLAAIYIFTEELGRTVFQHCICENMSTTETKSDSVFDIKFNVLDFDPHLTKDALI